MEDSLKIKKRISEVEADITKVEEDLKDSTSDFGYWSCIQHRDRLYQELYELKKNC